MLLASALPAVADDTPLKRDTATIDSCLQKQAKAPERCIGLLYKACTAQPSGQSTVGMEACSERERQVWQQKMTASLHEVLGGPLGKVQAKPENRPAGDRRATAVPGSDIIKGMQSTWTSLLAKMCDTESLQYEGGTASRVVYAQCVFEETARHALWLKSLTEDQH
jgi:uncharacterized protein YecT (DUF1311 family)